MYGLNGFFLGSYKEQEINSKNQMPLHAAAVTETESEALAETNEDRWNV